LEKVLVSIAGYDPSGGAGVLLDVAVFRRFGVPGAGLLTAVTAQNSRRVGAVRCLGGRFLLQQYETLVQDVDLAGIKVGLLGGPGNFAALRSILSGQSALPIVVDPVFQSSSGTRFLDKRSVGAFLDRIKGRVTILTPNLEEASLILGRRPKKPEDMKSAARRIADLIAAPCLLKGGHLAGKIVDVLYDGRRFFLFPHKKIAGEVHGTGCFLSSSLLCFLVMKKPLPEACSLAVDFTQAAFHKAVRLGRGRSIFVRF
jgi:hydroxymethylpyrimidine kinase/phosphomethylpyrimidine kinase